MREYIRPSRAMLVMLSAAALVVSACGEKKSSDTALSADSTLGRDLAMASRDTTVKPKLQDTAVTPPPKPVEEPKPAVPVVTPKPKPKPVPHKTAAVTPPPAVAPPPVVGPVLASPKPAEPLVGTVAAGTTLTFTSNSKVCTNTNAVGDKFTANLAESVPATNGISIPSGAVGIFEITELKTAKNSNDNTYLNVRLLTVQYGGKTYPVESTVQVASTERIRGATRSDDAKKVAGGAVIGAIIGQIIGKDTKGTIIGGAAGAAAGTAAAAATADYITCLNGGRSVVVKLDAPATVRMAPVN
ncbi:MAG: hypothetical protein ABJC26_14745 [Gemmatimonadaceae bacterium]